MAKQFDPRKVLKQIDNGLLKQFFTDRGQLTALPWDTLKETDIAPIFEAWQSLPEFEQDEIQLTFKGVNELADERGLSFLGGEISWRSPERLPEFEKQKSRMDKALWVYLNFRQIFDDGARFALADSLSFGRHWHKRNGLPKKPADALPLAVTDVIKDALSAAFTQFYSQTQGRGRHCHIEHYRRSNGNEYFFAYLDNYPDSHMSFNEQGSFQKRYGRAAFDVVFVYCPASGTIESYVPGGKDVREPLVEAFCAAVLGEEIGPERPNDIAYQLGNLMAADFAFPTDPRDGVSGVSIRRLKFDVLTAPGRKITLEAGPKDRPQAVHQMLANYLNSNALPKEALHVSAATLALTIQGVDGAKARTLTFEISHPSSCNLKSRSDDLRAIGERCLQRWGITS